MAPQGKKKLVKYAILTLLAMSMVSISVLSASQDAESAPLEEGQEAISLRNRVLDNENAVNIRAARQGYFIAEVSFPVKEEVYGAVQQKTGIDGIISPNLYIIHADKRQLASLKKQKIIHRVWRYTDERNTNILSTEQSEIIARISLFESADRSIIEEKIGKIGGRVQEAEDSFLVKIKGLQAQELAGIEGVEFVEQYHQPELFNDVTTIITGVAAARPRFNIYGTGEIIAIADTGLDSGNPAINMHDDFLGRIAGLVNVATSSCSTNPNDEYGHGTHMAGIILGDGRLSGSSPGANNYANSYAGVAPKARLYFQSMGDDSLPGELCPPALITGLFQPAYNQGARVHSNSWGISTNFGMYLNDAQNIDKFIWNNKNMNIIFAVGNSAWQGGAPRNDTIAPHAVAKNAVSVGASENYRPIIGDPPAAADNINELWPGSGRGPTDDNRIKPDIVAPATETFSTKSRVATTSSLPACTKTQSTMGGNYNLGPDYAVCGGTSAATAHVAGLAALTREYYRTQENVANPSSALIKATLINSAMEMGYGAPSNATGWGRVNISMVLPSAPERKLLFWERNSGLVTGKRDKCIFPVAAGTPFKATLVWSDKEAAILSPINLMNDLDLAVTSSNGVRYYGNDFTAPFDDSRDRRNNVEQVIIKNPAPGQYAVSVKAANIMAPPQPYAVVVTYKEGAAPGPSLVRCTW